MTNYFKIDRRLYDHSLFERDIYSRRDAWLWMIGAACYRDTEIFIGAKKYTLKRGQLSFSIRFLAAKWRWPKSNVVRYFSCLKSETMIRTEDGTGQLIITICNYRKFQDVDDSEGTENGTESGTKMGQGWDKDGTKKKQYQAIPSNTPIPPSEGFEGFWEAYPKKVSKPQAMKAYDRAIKRGTDKEAIISGAKAYARQRDAEKEPERMKYTKQPATWLNNDCWNDAIQEIKSESAIIGGRRAGI